MNILFILTSILFFIWIIRNIFFWTALWQLKEYRLDRIAIHIRETYQGKELLFSPLSITKWILFLGYGYVIFARNALPFYQLFIAVLYGVEALLVFKELKFSNFITPKFTLKSISILILAFIIVILLFFIPIIDYFIWMIFIDRFATLAIGFFVLSLSIPTEFYRDIQVNKAIVRLKKYKKILVIGVTGSYGKSSTKDYIAQILQGKFNVLKTKGTNNTPIGISNTILQGLSKKTEVFVVEMGAYKTSEIAYMSNIVKPKIGVITGLNDQHMSLFGSLENIMDAKYELIDSLPKDGIALFNGNSENVIKLYKKTKKKKVLYKCFYSQDQELVLDDQDKNLSVIFADNIKTDKQSIAFDAVFNGKRLHMKAPLIGIHNIENILPGIYIASHLGMKDVDIKRVVSLLSPLPKTMIRHQLTLGATIIDDTFNANPDAVLAVIEYMKIYRGKKILVLQPMIELGKSSEKEHYRVGKEISSVCDYLLLTNKNFYKAINDGINSGRGSCQVVIGSSSDLKAFLEDHVHKDTVIVFEGKEAGLILEKIL